MIGFVFERVENIVEKGKKMLVTNVFTFSHNVFKGFLSQGHLKSGWYDIGLTLSTQSRLLPTLKNKPFENIVG